ncbi:O-antigen polymerase [Aliivibrio finisterrensis]|uniref:Oligosaccharide repeat unit polymerase n=1 Tax=Aliivibrio finisterrensis TaxID=511998 RepID=A0ABY0I2A0_9GAMM|nr:O-antigen polymerase [Aliivibrio finisterrensis]RYU61826.1 oligosaccharide repeat unit polymerase [Aliivibrio finisterrensis]RYU80702.1 oligosaccharide repeat unit polymerase [Aliivibrio finisterrensis]
MTEFILIIVALLLLFAYGEVFRATYKPLHLVSPLLINCICWFFPLTFGFFNIDDFYPIEALVMVIFAVWIIGFNAFLSVGLLFTGNGKVDDSFNLKRSRIFFFTLSVFLSLKILYDIYIIGNSGSTGSFFLNLRLSAIGYDNSSQLYLVSQFYPLMYALLLWTFYIGLERGKFSKIFYFSLAFSALYVVATMSKFWLLNYVVSLSVLYVNSKGINSIKKLSMVGIIVVIIFFIMTSARDDGSAISSDFVKMISLYLFAPIVALQDVSITVVDQNQFGEYTFSSLYNILRFFGASSSEPISGILPYTKTPELTNIYTALQPFIADFGYLGVVVGLFIYSFFYLCTFLLSFKYTTSFIVYASMAGSLFLQFLTETLMMNLTGNIKIIICIILVRVLMLKKTSGVTNV